MVISVTTIDPCGLYKTVSGCGVMFTLQLRVSKSLNEGVLAGFNFSFAQNETRAWWKWDKIHPITDNQRAGNGWEQSHNTHTHIYNHTHNKIQIGSE